MTYSEAYFTARENWRDWRIEARALMRLARVTPGTRVLEIGCGGGGLMRMLRARGARVVGVDTLDVALNLARDLSLRAKRSNLSIHESDAYAVLARSFDSTAENAVPLTRSVLLAMIGKDNTLPFRAGSFDAIIGQHVAEHLPDYDAALCEWNRLLQPHGRIALATPNARYPDPAHFGDADHAHIFSPAELRRAFERAGFVVESCVTVFPFLTHLRVLRAFGVIAYRVFQRAPYFASRGRTILIGAQKH